jgi:DNA-directed RNA polymerase subunit RPC12/RpoP
MTKSVPNGYWKEWSNVEAALQKIMGENGGLIPGGSYFRKNRLTGLQVSIRLYHGGINEARRRLGVDGLKACARCKENISLKNYRMRSKVYPGGKAEKFRDNVCKKCSSKMIDEYRHTKVGKVRTTLRHLKSRAKLAGREYDLTEQWTLDRLEQIEWTCEVTGIKFDLYSPGQGNKNRYSMSVDRIDPSLGYTRDNVQFLITWANRAKSDLPMKEFIELCKLIASRNTN